MLRLQRHGDKDESICVSRRCLFGICNFFLVFACVYVLRVLEKGVDNCPAVVVDIVTVLAGSLMHSPLYSVACDGVPQKHTRPIWIFPGTMRFVFFMFFFTARLRRVVLPRWVSC